MKRFWTVLSLVFLVSYIYGKGSDTHFPGGVVTTDGSAVMVTLLDVPAASTTTILGVNGVSISTSSLVSGGTTFVKGASGTSNQFTQITYPRNVAIVVTAPAGGTITSLSGSCLVSGVDTMGISATETIAITTNPANSNRAWATVDTYAFSGFVINSSSSTALMHIGTSNKIGIAGDIRNSADVYKITQAGVDVSTCAKIGGCVSAKYNTIDMDKIVVPNGSIDYVLQYLNRKKYWGADKN